MKFWQVTLIGLTLSTLLVQQCLVNGQTCFIGNFTNAAAYLKNCNDPANVKSLVLNVTKLENVPTDIITRTQSIESIDVSNTSLQFINHTLNLCQWTKLASIKADDNNIIELQANMLSDCHQLIALSLTRNNISAISDQAFIGLNLLKALNLSNNRLASISGGTFKPLGVLSTLYLNGNQIRTIKLDTFAQNTKLQVLNLSCNAIADIEKNAFQQLNELTTLSIQCNPDLKCLDLNGTTKLSTLNANNASLSELDIPMSVVNVSADNNKIANISIALHSLLQCLSLRNNSFQNIGNLSSAQQLHDLDISNNNITRIDFTPLTQTIVEKITAVKNPIQVLNVSSLMLLPKIKIVDISTSQVDDKTVFDLLERAKGKGIKLGDSDRTSEIYVVVTLPPSDDKTNTVVTMRPASGNTNTTSPANDRQTNGDLLKRIQTLESALAEHDETKQSLSHLWSLIDFVMLVFFAFVAIKLLMFFRANHWKIPPISYIFSGAPNQRLNRRPNPFNDSLDPINQEVL